MLYKESGHVLDDKIDEMFFNYRVVSIPRYYLLVLHHFYAIVGKNLTFL